MVILRTFFGLFVYRKILRILRKERTDFYNEYFLFVGVSRT